MAFLIGFGLFFLAIIVTLIAGGVSKRGDRLVALSGRPTEDMHAKDTHVPVARRNTELPA